MWQMSTFRSVDRISLSAKFTRCRHVNLASCWLTLFETTGHTAPIRPNHNSRSGANPESLGSYDGVSLALPPSHENYRTPVSNPLTYNPLLTTDAPFCKATTLRPRWGNLRIQRRIHSAKWPDGRNFFISDRFVVMDTCRQCAAKRYSETSVRSRPWDIL